MNWKQKVSNRDLKVGIMGLGYVGLPLACAFARSGFNVLGFDIDEKKVKQINRNHSPLEDLSDADLTEASKSGMLQATDQMDRLSEVDAVHICVPTPLRKSRDPDISFIARATETLVEYFEPPGIITLESTTYPGTTEEILATTFSDADWDLEEEIHLAFSPERIDPGNREYGLENTPKVLGGYTDQARRVASNLYGEVVNEVVEVSSTRAAEMVKLLENTFRSINIGLANEMALLSHEMEIDVWEVIDAASTKPFGFMPFYPGPGLGGHCIPIDPLFLSWKARLHNTTSRFIDLADEINRSMPDYVTRLILDALNEESKSVNGSRICLLGVAYKPNVGDVRESPAIEVTRNLLDRGGDLVFCDPYVEEFSVEGKKIPSITQTEAIENRFDLSVILTDHDHFKWAEILESNRLLVDTRDALKTFDIPRGVRVVKL